MHLGKPGTGNASYCWGGGARRQTRGGAGHDVGARTVPPEKPPPAPSHLGHPQLPSAGRAVLAGGGPGSAGTGAWGCQESCFSSCCFPKQLAGSLPPRPPVTRGLGALPTPPLAAAAPARASAGTAPAPARRRGQVGTGPAPGGGGDLPALGCLRGPGGAFLGSARCGDPRVIQ